ncbi:MAG: cysteate synthase, partial [Candidatus Methanoperedens sp.]|nr:cysteate synthase [Candidatus Methanoperedens sp.]
MNCKTAYFNDRLKCDSDNGLLRANYRKKKLELNALPGIGKFHDWLPVNELITTDSGPVTYRSTELAQIGRAVV